MCVTTDIMTSAMGGHPGTLITGLLTSLWIGVAPVGLGLAACTQPLEAQLPHATTAAASAATSWRIDSAVLPPIMQYTPPSLVGTAPSTSTMYLPLLFRMVSLRLFSAWNPEAAISVSV